MEYVRLGRTGVTVSRLGFGGAPAGLPNYLREYPENTFDYTFALLQFVLSNPLVNVALVGMRTSTEVEKNVRVCGNTSGRIDIARLHKKYV